MCDRSFVTSNELGPSFMFKEMLKCTYAGSIFQGRYGPFTLITFSLLLNEHIFFFNLFAVTAAGVVRVVVINRNFLHYP